MRRKIPNLHALRAFEAAARLGSFKLASQELLVTPTAVSHHIRRLEDSLGLPLFIRGTRKVELTERGETLMQTCSQAFDMIHKTTAEITEQDDLSVLTIGVGPSFASRWLTPRLSQFWLDFPNVELRLTRVAAEDEIAQTQADLFLMWGPQDWPDMDIYPILPVHAVPVASPDLVEKLGLPQTPEDFLNYNLLFHRNHSEWNLWLKSLGAKKPVMGGGIIMDDENVLLRSAAEGQGAALSWAPLIDEEIKNGRLIALSSHRADHIRGYYLIVNQNTPVTPKLQDVIDWFLQQGNPNPTG
ncbi:LysR substrate-binding domain-containing protein [Halocynthiibacter styelae]|uniref:LysR family transcriptional regulator n=1 Tax=Halocynthiibacter styelae TaxID=2761955 RepID=A0A8J7LPN1_9RHOB|nr:LysR substrate-binding domain-containing protein [Paenihalocynthiibacter styelae]MBI1493826.1 LysR family transcriptional regulator [Paenihalocynthiibacter styelae]